MDDAGYRTPERESAFAPTKIEIPCEMPDATPAEIEFWEKIAVAIATTPGGHGVDVARKWADKLLDTRRSKFGRR